MPLAPDAPGALGRGRGRRRGRRPRRARPGGLLLTASASLAEGDAVVVSGDPLQLDRLGWLDLGDGARLQPGAILVPRPGERLLLGKRVKVDAGAVLYAGVSVGNDSILGHHAVVRSGARIGRHTVVSNLVMIEGVSRIGDHVTITAQGHVTQFSVIEDYAFLGPMATTTNDWGMAYRREGHGKDLRGPTLRRGCRIGAKATILPGVEIGEEAVVGAASLVARDVPARTLVHGVPARVVDRVSGEPIIPCLREHG